MGIELSPSGTIPDKENCRRQLPQPVDLIQTLVNMAFEFQHNDQVPGQNSNILDIKNSMFVRYVVKLTTNRQFTELGRRVARLETSTY
ncbi:hypothetical protein T05_4735 [Trichinella murrelli]|uniref:Uncharacterized protein n=1 Tax=Trichinella murrelli TaxID=144512 RepID=A0A0V0T0P5_9BILA|nr:hypothetical protein T05_4735 [Trichinella murrelli]